MAKGTSYSQEHPGQGPDDAWRSAEYFKKYQVLGEVLDICILIFKKWLIVFTLFLGRRGGGLSPSPVSRTCLDWKCKISPEEQTQMTGSLTVAHGCTEGAGTLGSIHGSTSYHLGGLGQVTLCICASVVSFVK